MGSNHKKNGERAEERQDLSVDHGWGIKRKKVVMRTKAAQRQETKRRNLGRGVGFGGGKKRKKLNAESHALSVHTEINSYEKKKRAAT